MKVGKKLLSVLLSIIMIMTSMSVCFGTFTFTAAAADGEYIAELADKLKDSSYAETLGLLGKSSKTGSKLAQVTNVTFTNYRNYKQAAELLRLLHNAMQETKSWIKAYNFSKGLDTNNKTDQAAACNGANTSDLYNDLINELEKKSVTIDNNIKTFIGSIYHMDGATAHNKDSNGKSSLSNWTNTITYTTSDYKGYLAQIGKASAVESSAEMSVKYVVKMQGNLTYKDGCDNKYHHQLWPAETNGNTTAPTTNSSNTEMKSKVNAHVTELNTYINMTYAQMLDMSASALDAKVTELNTAISNAVTYCGAQSTYDSLYADYAAGIANFRASVESAKAFQDFMPTVDAWNDFVAANPNYGVFQYPAFGVKGSEGHAALIADFATFKSYRDYLLTGGSIYDYLVDYNYIDETYYTNFYDNVVAYDLQDSKDAADALYIQYSAAVADTEGEGNVEMTLEEKTVVYNQFCGFINNIANYSAQVVRAVYTDGYQYLIDMREYFKCEINPAVLYFAENAYKSFTDKSTTAIWSEIEVAKGHQVDLDALYNEVKANAGQDKADQLLSGLKADAVTMIENLYKTLADRFTTEVNNAWDVYVALGKPTTLKVDTFLQLSAVMVSIEPSILTDLQNAGKAGYITQTTIDRYNELMKVGGIYEIWNAYASTFGFPDYKQTQIQYADRTPMEGDELKTANDPVTEAEMLKLIAALDKIITSDTVGGILGGLLGAEEGEAFNLGSMLTDLIKGALFTDDFINTVVQMLYPLVLGEFDKVWAGLPITVNYSGMNIKVQYQKTLHTILQEGEFEIYPDLLASRLEKRGQSTKYADNIATLKAAGGTADSWTSPKLVDPETGKLKLSWGVAEQAEKLAAGEITQAEFDKFFYDAFEDATSGLLPLLTSLITDKAWAPAKCNNIGEANATLTTLSIALQLGSRSTFGYANLLVPIYELLGVPYTATSSIKGSTDVSYVLEQILAPIFTFLGKLGDAPVATILEILPDLVYALAFRMAKPLLNMLNCDITYDASASLVGSVLADGAYVAVGDLLVTNEADATLPESMFVGGLNTILAHFGLNIPAIDQATLATLGELTTMSTNRQAWVYDNSAIGSGKAYTIKADKADVGYYLLTYVLNIVKDPDSLAQLLGIFMTQKDADGNPVLDAEGKKIADTEAIAKLQETMYADDGLNLDEINVGNAIAAIVELANQPEYIIDAYNWYAGEYSSPVGESVAMDIYLNPGNDWTEEKAQYLYDNLETLLTSVLTMAGADFNLETTISDALNGVFTNETVTALAKLLGSLSDLGALLAPKAEEDAEGEDAPEATEPDANEPETVAEGEEATEEEATEEAGLDIAEILTDLLKNELGIDLSVYAQYANIAEGEVVDFGVTDAETFVAALVDLLAPLKNVVDFILGGKDLTLIDSAITLQGYNGYNNAIIPLLEALGATPAAYTADADTLALTFNALVGVINKITTNDPAVANDGAIYTIIDMLPGIIYYISSNALSQGVDKLLTPVYAILDTIRPIYNVNLNELLAGIEIGEEGNKKPLGLDLKNLSWSFIFGLLNDLVGLDLSALQQVIYDVAKSIGVEYTSASTLGTFKKGAYNANFSQADLLTVVLSFVLEWATVDANAAKLDELLGTNGIIAALKDVFTDVEIEYGTPNWMYWFNGDEEAFNAYVNADRNVPNSLAAIDWENIGENDWDLDTAAYFAENIDVLVDTVIAMINKDKENAPKTVSALVSGLIEGYINAETINELVGLIAGLLGDIDENLLDAAGYLLGVDIVGLKSYSCDWNVDEKGAMTISHFAAELANVLDTYAGGLVNWLFFGDDYRFAKKSDKTDTIVINGGYGYEKGLAMILEALGAEAPAADEATTANVLAALATRVEAILANPVDEVIGLLPNLIYFLNANGAGVAVSNLLAPVNVLLDKLAAFGLEININELIGIDLSALSLENVVTIVEDATGLTLDAAEEILVNFCTGKIEKGDFIYKMSTTNEDTITILLYVALTLVSDDAFAEGLDEMLGTDFIANIKTVFADITFKYGTPDWFYYFDSEEAFDAYIATGEGLPNTLATIDWENIDGDWDLDTAKYFAKNIDVLVDTVIKMVTSDDEATVSSLVNGLIEGYITADTINELVGLITGLLGDIDNNLLNAAGYLLGVDIVGLKDYKCEADIDSAEAFAAELGKVLDKYAGGLINWLFFGDDYRFIKKSATEDMIVINGGLGYENGLALLLEALGADAPVAEDATSENVLTALGARVDAILANPVDEVIGLLPNLIYFLNANGAGIAIDNLLQPVYALLDKLAAFGLNVNLADLLKFNVNGKEIVIDLANLSLANVVEIVEGATGLTLDAAEAILVDFCTGKIEKGDFIYKMSTTNEDTITILLYVALELISDDTFAAQLNEMIGVDFITGIKTVFVNKAVEYAPIDWDYITNDKAGEYILEMPTNWNEGTAKAVTNFLLSEDFDALISGLIEDGKYESISALLTDKVNVFTSANLETIVGLITNLLGGIDDGLLEAAGVLLGANVVGLKAYTAPEGIETVDAFAAELANVLNTYAPGVVEWLLLGKDYKFFVKDADGIEAGLEGVTYITINGAHGYANGLAPLLEALGCEKLPAIEGNTTEEIIEGVLGSFAARINEIFADPVNEVVELLPNLIYFLNADGVSAAIKNTIAAVQALLDKLTVFGLNIDIAQLVDLKGLMGIADTDAAISLTNLSIEALLEAVSLMTGLDITVIESVLVGFDLGTTATYESVTMLPGEPKEMTLEAYKTVTLLANLVLITAKDTDNAAFLKELAGEEIYTMIMNLFTLDNIPVQEFSWLYADTDKVGTTFTTVETSEQYADWDLTGPFYTEEMAVYIADNFGLFVDNILYLLGLNINGTPVRTLTDLVNGLLDGSLYTEKNVIAIRDALAGVLANLGNLEVNGVNVGTYIVEVLAEAGIANIAEVAEVEVKFGTGKARDEFVAAICDVLAPLNPILKYLLADEDFSFFVEKNEDGKVADLITLPGADGYAYGIIPLLEVLGCNEDDILTPAEYKNAIKADESALLTTILNPLLNRVDELLPAEDEGTDALAEGILEMLPNLIYFINSNGVDTVVRNTLNAVYTILDVISPIAQLDLYALIGIDLAKIDMNYLLDMLVDLLNKGKADDAAKFSREDFNAIAELTAGKLESYTSKNGKTAYRMVADANATLEGGKAEIVSVIIRAAISFLMHESNAEALTELLVEKLGMTDATPYVERLTKAILKVPTTTYIGMNQAMAVVYYLFYSANIGTSEVVGGMADINAEWKNVINSMGGSGDPGQFTIFSILSDVLDATGNGDALDGVLDENGVASNGFFTFFSKIIDWFKGIIEFFKNLFN